MTQSLPKVLAELDWEPSYPCDEANRGCEALAVALVIAVCGQCGRDTRYYCGEHRDLILKLFDPETFPPGWKLLHATCAAAVITLQSVLPLSTYFGGESDAVG